MIDTIVAAVLVACLAVTCASLAFTIAMWSWQDYQDYKARRAKRVGEKSQ